MGPRQTGGESPSSAAASLQRRHFPLVMTEQIARPPKDEDDDEEGQEKPNPYYVVRESLPFPEHERHSLMLLRFHEDRCHWIPGTVPGSAAAAAAAKRLADILPCS